MQTSKCFWWRWLMRHHPAASLVDWSSSWHWWQQQVVHLINRTIRHRSFQTFVKNLYVPNITITRWDKKKTWDANHNSSASQFVQPLTTSYSNQPTGTSQTWARFSAGNHTQVWLKFILHFWEFGPWVSSSLLWIIYRTDKINCELWLNFLYDRCQQNWDT